MSEIRAAVPTTPENRHNPVVHFSKRSDSMTSDGAPLAARLGPPRVGLLLLLSGVLGGLIGGLTATWQWAVEVAQIHAGVIAYPPDSLATAIQAHIWSLVNQLLSMALKSGVSEQGCSVALSVVMSALALQAVSLVVYLFARDIRYSILCGLVVVFTKASSYGATYPIDLLPTPHTYGALGLSFCAVAIALMGHGWLAASAFLAGLSVAVHPSTGAWLIAITAVVMGAGRREIPRRRFVVASFFLALALSAVSFVVHLIGRPHVAPLSPADAAAYFQAFIRDWDFHRQPIRWSTAGVWFNVAAVVVSSLAWLRAQGTLRLFLAFTSLSGTAALVCAGLGAIPLQYLPQQFVVAIPGRFLNFDALLFAPLLLGLAVDFARTFDVARIAPATFLATLALSDRSPVIDALSNGSPDSYGLPQPALLACLSFLAALGSVVRLRRPSASTDRRSLHSSKAVFIVASAVCLAGGFLILHPRSSASKVSDLISLQAEDQSVFTVASQGSGTILTASNLSLVQLRTRRPVLLDAGILDPLVYSIEGAPFVSAVLQDVYGISYFASPEAGRHRGGLAPSSSREHWEHFTLDDWLRISVKYGVTDILAYREWQLSLPATAQGKTLILYHIPR